MQMVARIEKVDPPSATAVCGAAALAVVRVLSDERAEPEGPWHEAVAAWTAGPIRKLTRRARGAAWRRAQEPDGCTVTWGGAEVRAFVPSPMDQVPESVAKLQISASALEDPDEVAAVESAPGLTIAVSADVEMSWGKQAAQCAHAAQLAWRDTDQDTVRAWLADDTPLRVVRPTKALWRDLIDDAPVQIRDGGFTEVPAGTLTTVAWWG